MDLPDAVHEILDAREAMLLQRGPVDLDRLCGGDSALRNQVEQALEGLRRAEELLSERGSRPAPLPESFAVDNRFHAIRVLADGAQSRVLLARDATLKREVVVKLSHWSHAAARLRSRKEGEIAAKLDRWDVPVVYGSGVVEDGRPFLVLRYVPGATMEEKLRELFLADPADAETQRRYRRLFAALADACRTVDYAHSRGIVHADLKPGNLLLRNDGEVVVLDWGTAVPAARRPGTVADESQASVSHATTLRRLAAHVGSACYLSPERMTSGAELGAWSDVYSLGVVLLRLVRPFDDLLDSLVSVQAGATPQPSRERRRLALDSGTERALLEICRRACSERIGERPGSASDLAEAIDSALKSHTSFLGRPFERWLRRRPT